MVSWFSNALARTVAIGGVRSTCWLLAGPVSPKRLCFIQSYQTRNVLTFALTHCGSGKTRKIWTRRIEPIASSWYNHAVLASKCIRLTVVPVEIRELGAGGLRHIDVFLHLNRIKPVLKGIIHWNFTQYQIVFAVCFLKRPPYRCHFSLTCISAKDDMPRAQAGED